ncbi:YbaB/EbfC family nucleoid-associated protein [Methylomagnum ishizawai]|uniref:YbaB/EbfC family nucleoid-associated protein n=1 Tax=Methylomagnum ishizawai TaxID=1760988 RepID=UPI001C33E46F|nr:YbaB/EbfC family nucleoid-associated protein [Methylomagnum ishizawai]BBL74560.1 nucleoid-associated protein [Methylomagnum ishizawai]
MKNPLAHLMQQAQQMQENLKKAQEELAELRVQGESGGGLVKIAMTGKRQVLKVEIDDSLLKDDRDMLEDLVAAAVNDAVNKVANLKQEKLAGLTGGMELPAGFKLPF